MTQNITTPETKSTRERALSAFVEAYDHARIGDWDHGRLIAWLTNQAESARAAIQKADAAQAILEESAALAGFYNQEKPDAPPAAPVAQGEHTPGPWHARTQGTDAYVWGPAPLRAGCIAKVNLETTHNVTRAEREADLAVILAAPDMLAALRDAECELHYASSGSINPKAVRDALAKVRAAMIKATKAR